MTSELFIAEVYNEKEARSPRVELLRNQHRNSAAKADEDVEKHRPASGGHQPVRTHPMIYVDGEFVGNVPSDVILAAGEHVVKVTLGVKEWTRTVHITGGEIQLRAEFPDS